MRAFTQSIWGKFGWDEPQHSEHGDVRTRAASRKQRNAEILTLLKMARASLQSPGSLV